MSINTITYDGKAIPNFVTITGVKVQVLPDIENKFLSAPRMTGVIDAGHNLGTKIISIDIMIKDSSLGAIDKSEKIAEWLRVDDLKSRKLVLPSHPNSYYLAKPNNSIELSDNIRTFRGTIEFLCTNPFRISSTTVTVEGNSTTYRGTANTSPILELRVTSPCPNIQLSVKNRGYNNFINLVGPFVLGDVIKIDLKTTKTYKNGKEDMKLWGLNSKPHKLCKGSNTYTLSNATLTLKYEENFA